MSLRLRASRGAAVAPTRVAGVLSLVMVFSSEAALTAKLFVF